MRRFPTPAHLAAWAGVAPGNNESGGRQRSVKTRKGNMWLKTALAARYQRIAGRRGAKRAIMVVAHRLLIIVYQVIVRREPYRELGADYLDRQRPAATAVHLLRRLRQLGVEVQVLASADDTVIVAT